MSVLCLNVNDKVIVEKIMNGEKNKILQYSRYLEFTKMAKSSFGEIVYLTAIDTAIIESWNNGLYITIL